VINPLSQITARFVGWQYEGAVPKEKKYIALSIPHTSNWDAILMMLMARTIGLEMKWLVKNSVAKGPLAHVVNALGGIPIDRSRAGNIVDQMADEFRTRDELRLFLAPEGTRRRVDYWKSGFYRIARAANVPVACGYLDYARKRAGVGDPVFMTGDVRVDLDRIREAYAKINPRAHTPKNFGPMRLREEDAP
jgi:1-acyl-sn-glycerol-3-phosphate acyltransferase